MMTMGLVMATIWAYGYQSDVDFFVGEKNGNGKPFVCSLMGDRGTICKTLVNLLDYTSVHIVSHRHLSYRYMTSCWRNQCRSCTMVSFAEVCDRSNVSLGGSRDKMISVIAYEHTYMYMHHHHHHHPSLNDENFHDMSRISNKKHEIMASQRWKQKQWETISFEVLNR